MNEVSEIAWNVFPFLLLIIALSLVIIASYVVRHNPMSKEDSYWTGHREGYAKGWTEGNAAGKQSEYLEHQNFVQCPECDHAIHVPCHLIIEGEPGAQRIRAEVDQTELTLHMHMHSGLWPEREDGQQ